MNHDFWHKKWESNQIGFHQNEAHSGLSEYFPELNKGARVLVPLCGKAVDMLWLANKGYVVVGVELSEIAAKDFFVENGFDVLVSEETLSKGVFKKYYSTSISVEIYVGDFLLFSGDAFDALYDRAALIALPDDMRPAYVEKTRSLLTTVAQGLVITTVYDDSIASGPPFSVSDLEIKRLWGSKLEKVGQIELIDDEPRWKSKGLTSFQECFWLLT
jgi:thiopurine S-methyltransferase